MSASEPPKSAYSIADPKVVPLTDARVVEFARKARNLIASAFGPDNWQTGIPVENFLLAGGMGPKDETKVISLCKGLYQIEREAAEKLRKDPQTREFAKRYGATFLKTRKEDDVYYQNTPWEIKKKDKKEDVSLKRKERDDDSVLVADDDGDAATAQDDTSDKPVEPQVKDSANVETCSPAKKQRTESRGARSTFSRLMQLDDNDGEKVDEHTALFGHAQPAIIVEEAGEEEAGEEEAGEEEAGGEEAGEEEAGEEEAGEEEAGEEEAGEEEAGGDEEQMLDGE